MKKRPGLVCFLNYFNENYTCRRFCSFTVGSFIWTHLTNLQESQSLSPSTINVKKLIGDKFLQNKWNTDVRKFSRYFETSYYSKELQAGATVDGNIIFSQESYLPRLVTL